MKVTPPPEASKSLEFRVHAELLALRKLRGGVTVEALAQSEAISQLLGAGDPYLTYTRLQHEVLASNLDIAIQAAAASLGFSSDGQTHLERLDDFASEVGLEQRQARRHSDKGIAALARLISSNWPTETVPQLTITIGYAPDTGWHVHLVTQYLHVVAMSEPEVTVIVGGEHSEAELLWVRGENNTWRYARTDRPLEITDRAEETSVAIVWRGELWPKFNVQWLASSPVVAETLGNKLLLRVRSEGSP